MPSLKLMVTPDPPPRYFEEQAEPAKNHFLKKDDMQSNSRKNSCQLKPRTFCSDFLCFLALNIINEFENSYIERQKNPAVVNPPQDVIGTNNKLGKIEQNYLQYSFGV